MSKSSIETEIKLSIKGMELVLSLNEITDLRDYLNENFPEIDNGLDFNIMLQGSDGVSFNSKMIDAVKRGAKEGYNEAYSDRPA